MSRFWSCSRVAEGSPSTGSRITHSKLTIGRRPLELWRLSLGGPSLALNLAWVLAAISAAAAVWRLQIANRAPLIWDEAVRVDAGASLTYAIRSGDFHGAWDWIHTQVFYPFLGPAFNGLTLLVTHDPLAAAWVPSLVAYTLAGMLAGRLALDLGAGPVGALCAGL